MEHITGIQVVAIPGFNIAPGARAMLVTDHGDGRFEVKPVEQGKSLLNVRTELMDHLNAYPHTDEWLEELRDYCEGRLAARAEAHRTGGFVIPRAPKRWDIAHVQAFSPLSGGAA